MELHLTTVPVNNIEESLRFYHEIFGLPILRQNTTPDGMVLVFLGVAGQPNLELIYTPGQAAHQYAGFSIGFHVESLDEAMGRLAAFGFSVIRGPISPNPTIAFAFVRDPNGIEIQLIEYKK